MTDLLVRDQPETFKHQNAGLAPELSITIRFVLNHWKGVPHLDQIVLDKRCGLSHSLWLRNVVETKLEYSILIGKGSNRFEQHSFIGCKLTDDGNK